MRVPESVKILLKRATCSSTNNNKETVVTTKDDVHYVPPGQWPATGPKPSKIGVLFYYLSIAFCVVGILMMAKCSYAPHKDRPSILALGSILVVIGFFFLGVSNFIYNREQRKLVEYLQGKIAELMEENRGKGPRSPDS
eukprot:TRINITY_DN5313_c0_g1_i2.p1 TRINITY_DN5313_c0_g1~~TRINITY_DN5313_c0_g1_i2.p1  ORF type:complete len:139 (-),score=34.65 TRINITY_DN5313_c0_g1_i2:638-1054(-)